MTAKSVRVCGIFLVSCVVAALLYSVYCQRREIGELKLENGKLNERLRGKAPIQANLETKVREAQNEARELQDLLNRRIAESTAAVASKPVGAGAQAAALADASKASELVKHWLDTMDDPDVTRLANRHQTAQVQRRYASLFQHLSLPPDTADSLTQLLVDRRNAALDVAVSAIKDGGDPMADPSSTSDLIAAQRANVDSQIKALLGDSGYQDFRTQEQSLGQSSVMLMLQQSLQYSNAPLTELQANQIQQVLETNHVGHLNDKVVQAIVPSLTNVQAQALQDFYAEQRAAADVRRAQAGQFQNINNTVTAGTTKPRS